MSSQPPKKRKSEEDAKSNKRQKQNTAGASDEVNQGGFFSKLVLYILQAGIGKARADIFCKQVTKFGGELQKNLSDDVTHLIVDEQMDIDRLCRILKLDKPPLDVKIVKASWISKCLSEQELVDTEEHELHIPMKYLKTNDNDSGIQSKLSSDQKDTDNASSSDKAQEQQTSIKNSSEVVMKQDEVSSSSVVDKDPAMSAEDINVHWRSPTKKAVADDSDDSSYVPSDDDEYQQELTKSGQSSSNTSTPDVSPAKLPVSKNNFLMKSYRL